MKKRNYYLVNNSLTVVLGRIRLMPTHVNEFLKSRSYLNGEKLMKHLPKNLKQFANLQSEV